MNPFQAAALKLYTIRSGIITRRFICFFLSFAAVCFAPQVVTALPTEYYAAPPPSGTASGDGSIAKPWDLQTALHKTLPGRSTLYLRKGVFTAPQDIVGEPYTHGVFTSYLAGTATDPIFVKPHPGEVATIDGGIYAYGTYTTFWGIRITNSKSVTRNKGGDAPPFGFHILGRGIKLINSMIFNAGQGGIFWSAGDSGGDLAELYGNILWGSGCYNCGLGTPDQAIPRGSGLYAQNRTGGIRNVGDNISFRAFTAGLDSFSNDRGALLVNDFNYEGNIIFDNAKEDIFLGPCGPGNVVRNNFTYHRYDAANNGKQFNALQLGYSGFGGPNITILNNFLIGGELTVDGFMRATVLNNTVSFQAGPVIYLNPVLYPFNWNNGTYFNNRGLMSSGVGNRQLTFADWKNATGFDANSTFTSSFGPAGMYVAVRPNKYESGRAHIVVFNFENKDSYAVNIAGIGLKDGSPYEVWDVQHLTTSGLQDAVDAAPVLKGIYSSANPTITIPLNLTAITQVVGAPTHFDFPINTHTPKQFNAFLIKGGSGGPPVTLGVPTNLRAD